jgi:hypothetical protein
LGLRTPLDVENTVVPLLAIEMVHLGQVGGVGQKCFRDQSVNQKAPAIELAASVQEHAEVALAVGGGFQDVRCVGIPDPAGTADFIGWEL